MNKEALTAMVEGTKEDRVFLAEQSFGLFCLYYFQDYFKYPLAPYHYDFIQDIEDMDNGVIREVLWIGFRESAKTTFAQLGLIWYITFRKRVYMNVDSYSSKNSERSLFDIAYHLMNNKKYIADFGHIYTRSRGMNEMKQNKVDNFTTENGCRLEASTTGIDVRGRKHFEYRPDFRWVDDFETHDTKDSVVITEGIRNNLTSAMGGMEGHAAQLYTANYLTEYANVQWLIDRAKIDDKIRVRNIPVIIDGQPAWSHKYTMTDEQKEQYSLDNPDKEPKVSIEDKQKQLGSHVFSYEMMNQPIDDSLAELKTDFIQHVTEEEVLKKETNCYITIDSAVSKKESADYTGITINRVDLQNKWYVHTYRMKINSSELIDHMFYLQTVYKPKFMGLEETTFTMAIQPFIQEEMRKRQQFFAITPVKHKGVQKETRIRGLIPRWESKSIFLVGENTELKEEMRVFPRGRNDDVLDSLSMQLHNATKPYFTPQGMSFDSDDANPAI